MQKTLIDTGTPFVRQVELLIEKCGLDVDLFTVGVAAAPEVDGPANYGVLILPIDDEIGDDALKWATARAQPTAFVQTDPRVGMTAEHVEHLLTHAATCVVR